MESRHEHFGLAIKKVRIDCGLTQEVLAERAGISCRYLIAIENEGRIPKLPIVYRLIYAMHISADRIFYPEQSSEDSERAQLIHMLEACSDRDIHILLTTAKAMLQKQ
ncbi:MAG: helix-turn-helix transcriptional regulator [Lachnospiraceae bacterium]|nr:helix-turn-helix transcriptional regulator [Lachnospiraceae bacterium]